MLGRLQMTVDDCISSFIEFGDGTLARPRLLHNYTFPLLGRSKYAEETIHKVIQKVVDDYVPGNNEAGKGQQHTFAAPDDKCKTYLSFPLSSLIAYEAEYCIAVSGLVCPSHWEVSLVSSGPTTTITQGS